MIPASASPRLAARGLAAGYPGRRVIDGLDLEIAPGRITMIIGANASGKSTLLGTLARLHTPLAGRVEVDDVDVRSVPRRRFAQTAIHRDRQPDDFENAHDSRLNLTYIR